MAGKSTLTAHWASRGGRFVSDDWFVVNITSDEISVTPSHPSIRLRDGGAEIVGLPEDSSGDWDEEYEKHWYKFGSDPLVPSGDRLDLCNIVCYRREPGLSEAVRTELSRQESIMRLVSHLFILDVRSRTTWERVLDGLRNVAERVPVWELCAREGPEGLTESSDWLARL
jgi:hypothetical protein